MEAEFDVVVRARDELADGVVALELERTDGAEMPHWRPGAHLDLVLTDDLIRQYSLCGDPADRTMLRVAVLREADGRGGSAHVHDQVGIGQKLRVRGPRNHFALEPSDSYLFIAGGIGITPILPMIRACEDDGARWRLVYGGRRRASMAFRDELQREFGQRVTLWPQDERGLIELAGVVDAAAEGTSVYCCGPEALIAATEAVCRERPGVTVYVERFAPKDQAVGESGSFEVELARSGRTITVAAGVSIVDALAEHDVQVDTSCREGTCGTCETAVLSGVPDHRDSLLTEEERAENDVMFVCVSRCRSGRLVLDL
ncbi:PDR/VanB family oxidoreductase [Pseudonocardia spinosispora]|uniref:PDR/VanB family oxidoreductase n=1 Tax=Pseudonocardia spinosispora TaxID=103441 RepID=UPI0003FE9BE2|nr:PDR/VanB family oxidoreductase [Pseudonocardia spinosispora]